MSASVKKIKEIGIEQERNLVNLLKLKGFMAASLQSSANSLPDVICGDTENFFVFEVKTTSTNNIKIYKRQIWTLKKFAYNFNAIPYIATIFTDRDPTFRFIQLRQLNEHEKMFTIDYNNACLKGQDINEIISNEIQKKLI